MSQQKPDPVLQEIQNKVVNIKTGHSRLKGQFLDNLNDATTMMIDRLLAEVIIPQYDQQKKLEARIAELEKEKKAATMPKQGPHPKKSNITDEMTEKTEDVPKIKGIPKTTSSSEPTVQSS